MDPGTEIDRSGAEVAEPAPEPSGTSYDPQLDIGGSEAPSVSEVHAETSMEPSLPPPPELPPPPVKRNRWGAPKGEPAVAAEEGGGEKKRKRKSRWETDETAMAIVPAGDGSNRALVAVFPKEVTLSNGITVRVCIGPMHGIIRSPGR